MFLIYLALHKIFFKQKIDRTLLNYIQQCSIYFKSYYFLDLKKLGIFTLSLSKSNNGSLWVVFVVIVSSFFIVSATFDSILGSLAVDTILAYFNDTNDDPNSFDLIATGDLGVVGSKITLDLLKEKNLDISKVYTDCGLEIFDLKAQDVHCGGSGCGCSASVFCGYIYDKLKKKEFNKVMLVATGALLSPNSTLQKQTIPSIANAVVIVNE